MLTSSLRPRPARSTSPAIALVDNVAAAAADRLMHYGIWGKLERNLPVTR
jgi:hypothetical protein